MTATQETRVAREHSLEQRIAWSHWWDRWHELERDEPSERTLVVCATCSRYRDGAGHWVEMPSGLNDLLVSARSLCVSHGLCSACTARELHNVKHLGVCEPAGTGSMND